MKQDDLVRMVLLNRFLIIFKKLYTLHNRLLLISTKCNKYQPMSYCICNSVHFLSKPNDYIHHKIYNFPQQVKISCFDLHYIYRKKTILPPNGGSMNTAVESPWVKIFSNTNSVSHSSKPVKGEIVLNHLYFLLAFHNATVFMYSSVIFASTIADRKNYGCVNTLCSRPNVCALWKNVCDTSRQHVYERLFDNDKKSTRRENGGKF
ncbi:hypothetical protein AGLY_013048 [Aphis glycines]|uniref:Uncharacterized protein n=1 Tax=Aphis glycines TaxID=307491 RepID=A0A6G0T7R5_APHGL|nr:hypothetical protein AGLY_013048 [Aphis glycines]